MKTSINQKTNTKFLYWQIDQIKSYKNSKRLKWYYANHYEDMQRLGIAQRQSKQTESKPGASPLHCWTLGRKSLVEVWCCGCGGREAWGDGSVATNAALGVALPGTFFSALVEKLLPFVSGN